MVIFLYGSLIDLGSHTLLGSPRLLKGEPGREGGKDRRPGSLRALVTFGGEGEA